ncbi:MAG: transglutaminaseTgpA domain-containing protein [Verrucomicrobia bacterium]|nr:transglutaminaseTgpA domain-containing protein [Verrucomicrobiota bacterium]
MTIPEQQRERTAGWVLGGWLLLHQFLLGDSGMLSAVVILLICAGMMLRIFGIFPPSAAGWILLAAAVVVPVFVPEPTAAVFGSLGGLLGAVLLLRPLSPRRGLWILLCAVSVLASISLQEGGTVNTVFMIMDVAVLMFVAEQIHAPAEAEAAVRASVLRSLRLILPVAVIVTAAFWLFPAISSRTNVAFVRFWGSDLLTPGEASEVRLTRRIAFVATFPESSAVPSFSDLYWRGQVLEKNEGLRWAADPARINSRPASRRALPDPKWRYSQILGPDRALAALDLPVSVLAAREGKKATVLETGGFTYAVLGAGDVGLEISSAPTLPDDPLLPAVASGSLGVPENIRSDPRLRTLAPRLFASGTSLPARLESLGHFLAAGGYSYTLRPGKMNPGDVAWFLFQHRKGFCGHYAAAAANILRIGGIPARIVTGYRGGTWNPWLRTLTVRDSDAHAWVEAWDENARHWTRFDPTSFVAPELAALMEVERNPDRWPWFRCAATYAAAVITRAGAGLNSARSSLHAPWTVAALLALAGAAGVLWWRRRCRGSTSEIAALCLENLERQAALKNRSRRPGETPLAWLARLETMSPTDPEGFELKNFSESYGRLVYADSRPSAENAGALKHSSRRLIRIWKEPRPASR